MTDDAKLYIGTKTVKATPMTRQAYNDYRGWALPADEDGADAGFLVEYLDGGAANHPHHMGYISWSPADVFARAYHGVTERMTFGHALVCIKDGERVCRRGWNGKGMWLSLTQPVPSAYVIHGFGKQFDTTPDEQLPLLPWIGMRTADGKYVPWLASQTDMLAEDWQLYLPE